jgi:hypothetical protein
MARYRDYRLAMKMVFLGPSAADAWAAQAADHSAVHLAKRRAEVPDFPWAWDRDFLSVMAERERPLVLERQDVREWRPVPRLQDELPTAGRPSALRVEPVLEPPQAQQVSLQPAR